VLGCEVVPRPISLRTCRELSRAVERAKQTAAIAQAMASMSDRAIGAAGRLEHSKPMGRGTARDTASAGSWAKLLHCAITAMLNGDLTAIRSPRKGSATTGPSDPIFH